MRRSTCVAPSLTARKRAATQLLRAREAAGLSQEAAARLIGVSPRSLGAWERAEVPLTQIEALISLEAAAAARSRTEASHGPGLAKARAVKVGRDHNTCGFSEPIGPSAAAAETASSRIPKCAAAVASPISRAGHMQRGNDSGALVGRVLTDAATFDEHIAADMRRDEQGEAREGLPAGDDGGKTPRSGATGIQHPENDGNGIAGHSARLDGYNQSRDGGERPAQSTSDRSSGLSVDLKDATGSSPGDRASLFGQPATEPARDGSQTRPAVNASALPAVDPALTKSVAGCSRALLIDALGLIVGDSGSEAA